MEAFSTFYKENILLLPILIMCFSLGRGVENTLTFIYFISGLIVFVYLLAYKKYIKRDVPFYIPVFIGLIMYLSWLFSGYYSGVFLLGISHWVASFLSASVILYTLSFYNKKALDLLFNNKWLLFGLLFFIISFVFKLSVCYVDNTCEPTDSVSSMSVPLLYPFFALILYSKFGINFFKWFLGLSSILLGFVILADSRTEVVMFLVALIVFLSFYFRKLFILIFTPLALVVVILIFSYLIDSSDGVYTGNLNEFLHEVSSGRLKIWEHAISNYPESLIFGSGIDNTDAFLPKYEFTSALHNAFLEIWYETGFLGLGLWIALFAYFLKDSYKVYLSLDSNYRMLYVVFISSLSAVIVAGLLDKGYLSFYYKFYVYFAGAALYIIGTEVVKLGAKR